MKNEQIKTRTLIDIIVSHFYDKGAKHMGAFFEDNQIKGLQFLSYGEEPEWWNYMFKKGEINGTYGFEEWVIYDVETFVKEGKLVSVR